MNNLIKKYIIEQWWIPAIIFIVLILVFFAITTYGITNATISNTDTFTDGLELPKNITLAKPIDIELREKTELVKQGSAKNTINFQLYSSLQPGLYEYDLWINSKENGTIFLKVYEITKGTPLSASQVKAKSTIQLTNTNGVIKKFGTKKYFTIYEGDWGNPYGARFEVWFKPNNKDQEQKLLEKNYIIEGWMR